MEAVYGDAVLGDALVGDWLAAVVESSEDAITGANLEGTVTRWNPAAERLYGYTAQEMLGRPVDGILPVAVRRHLPRLLARIADGERIKPFPAHLLTRSGLVVDVSLSLCPVYDCGVVVGVSAIGRDITGALGAAQGLRREDEDYRLAFTSSPMPMWIYDTTSLKVLAVNEAAVVKYGYKRDEFLGMCVENLYPPDELEVFRTQILAEPLQPSSECRSRHLRADGSVIDVSMSGSPVLRSSGLARLVVAHDITAEVASDERGRRIQQQLDASLRATIEAIAATIEQRDPYTGGHQRRVAELAVAIAGRLGVDADTVEGIRLAATIHDIGKIGLPAEVLVFPGPISPVLFEVVKTHSQVGHDIIANIAFPWPIAEIVLQHHERLDGSGYPQGLHGSQILLQARILAVADVTEAMTSHRPYRPARGSHEAMAELKRGRGIQYDADAVDACVALFTGGDFRFAGSERWTS